MESQIVKFCRDLKDVTIFIAEPTCEQKLLAEKYACSFQNGLLIRYNDKVCKNWHNTAIKMLFLKLLGKQKMSLFVRHSKIYHPIELQRRKLGHDFTDVKIQLVKQAIFAYNYKIKPFIYLVLKEYLPIDLIYLIITKYCKVDETKLYNFFEHLCKPMF